MVNWVRDEEDDFAVMDDRKKEVENFELFIATKRGLSDLEEAHSMVNIIIFSSYFYR